VVGRHANRPPARPRNRAGPTTAGRPHSTVNISGASSGAFDQTTSMPNPLRFLHLRRSRERERVDEPPLAHARGHSPTKPEQAPGYRIHCE
jgi:hypothetical protein